MEKTRPRAPTARPPSRKERNLAESFSGGAAAGFGEASSQATGPAAGAAAAASGGAPDPRRPLFVEFGNATAGAGGGAHRRRLAATAYGFTGDPSTPVSSKHFGYLAWAGML